ncbi:membrane protein [Brevibacillus laterosporus]|nr:membrane protein [Brevibacillus laterosporus]
MRSYLSGAGLSLFFANLIILFIYVLSPTIDFTDLRTSSFQSILWFVTLFNYICCIFGWFLLYIFRKRTIISWHVYTFFFIVLGSIFAVPLYFLAMRAIIVPIITVLGSVIFFISQYNNSKFISTLFSLSGPILTVLLIMIVQFF